MGMKSRSNWNLSACLKEDCVNRGLCDFCVKYDLYLAQEAFDAVGRAEYTPKTKTQPDPHRSPINTKKSA